MPEPGTLVAIVDYGMGNLFSVTRACEQVGLAAQVSSDRDVILGAAAVILPGVGAFGVAMENLARLNLIEALREAAGSGRPFVGICLGMQLLMTESSEFGRHRGLGLIEGDVVPLGPYEKQADRLVKIPHVGWNRIQALRGSEMPNAWQGSLLDGLPDSEFMYFVHSLYCRPLDAGVMLSHTRYGNTEFCSSLVRDNVFGCQFHPERSGPAGLTMYRSLAVKLGRTTADRVRGSEVPRC